MSRNLVVLAVALLSLVAVVIWSAPTDWVWTGFGRKSLWDWFELLVVPAALGAAGVWFSRQQASNQRRIAEDDRRADALQTYLDPLSEQLLDEKRPLGSAAHPATGTVARARTLTVVRGLDGRRRGAVLRFLYESSLILVKVARRREEEPIVDLRDADFSNAELNNSVLSEAHLANVNLILAELEHADLGGADLDAANLAGAHMRFANLAQPDTLLRRATKSHSRGRTPLGDLEPHSGATLNMATLIKADLSFADLQGASLMAADLRRANLSAANLCRADLQGADLRGADFSGADLRGADLQFAKFRGARFDRAYLDGAIIEDGSSLTEKQLKRAHTHELRRVESLGLQVAKIVRQGHSDRRPSLSSSNGVPKRPDEDPRSS